MKIGPMESVNKYTEIIGSVGGNFTTGAALPSEAGRNKG